MLPTRRSQLILLLTILISTVTLAQTATERIAFGNDVTPNITYLVANNTELKLDVYRQRKANALSPTVMFIHGGGWVTGSKEKEMLWFLPYLEMGFSVVNVEYRLAKVSLAPAAVEDCRCALHWIINHAQEYKFDPQRIIVTGPSAGGHLSLMTGMLPVEAGFDRQCPADSKTAIRWTGDDQSEPHVAAIINWFGITEVVDMLHGPNQRSYAREWFGSLPQREQLAIEMSPLHYVRANLPPILSLHGDADKTVPYSHAVRLHAALAKAGAKNELFTAVNGGHGDFSPADQTRAWATIRQFLEKQGLMPSAIH